MTGHEGPVLSVKYDPFGQFIASGGSQSDIFLWRPPTQSIQNSSSYIPTDSDNGNPHVQTLRGNKRAVLDLAWSRDGTRVFSAGADHTVGNFDIESGTRIRKHIVTISTASENSGMVNSIDVVRRGTELIVAGTDAGLVIVYDPRDKYPAYTLRPKPFATVLHQQNMSAAAVKRGSALASSLSSTYPILAVATNDDGSLLFSAGVDDTISAWDPRSLQSTKDTSSNINTTAEHPIFTLAGHTNSVTSLKVSPDNQTLLSNSMDSTVRTWNIRPFVAGPPNSTANARALRVHDGAPAGIETRLLRAAWSTFPEPSSKRTNESFSSSSSTTTTSGTYIAAGSGDHTAVVWDSRSGRLLHKLTGHQGAVTDVNFSPTEPILASASADGSIILGELSPNGTRTG